MFQRKRIFFESMVLVLLLTLNWGCTRSETAIPAPPPTAVTKSVSPQAITPTLRGVPEPYREPKSIINLPPEYNVIQVLDTNLDIDQLDEQIIAFKQKDDPEDRIQIMVVDFDTVRNTYIPVWVGKTLSTNNRTFTLRTYDILGDHVSEILSQGRNHRGEHTLDIFRKTLPPQGLGLYYTSIFSFAVDGYIEVQEQPRSEAYRLLQRNDPSFPIFVFTRDPESSNFMDMIRYTYVWNHQEQMFVQGRREKLPGQIQAERRLAELFAKNAEGFEEFLAGPWFKVGSPHEMIHFDNRNQRIVFYNNETQEILVWLSSSRTIYRGLFINTHNEAIPSIQKQISISVQGMDTIDVQVRSVDDIWSSTYKKLSTEIQKVLITSESNVTALAPLTLEGSFKNEENIELVFHSNEFTLNEMGRQSTGVFVLYQVRDHIILELKAIQPNRSVESVRSFEVVFTEEKKDNQTLRTLSLTPIRVGATRITVLPGDALQLFQIQ